MSETVSVEVSGWTKIGSSANAEFYEVEPQVLVVVPHDGTADNAETARASVQVQLEHLRRHGRRAGVIVMMDRVTEQDSGARTVYREAPDPAFQACFALVGGTAFGRAVASVFLGLSRPRVPTKMFATFDEALAWARRMAATQGGS
jgi:hypothetical protein